MFKIKQITHSIFFADLGNTLHQVGNILLVAVLQYGSNRTLNFFADLGNTLHQIGNIPLVAAMQYCSNHTLTFFASYHTLFSLLSQHSFFTLSLFANALLLHCCFKSHTHFFITSHTQKSSITHSISKNENFQSLSLFKFASRHTFFFPSICPRWQSRT